MEIALHTVLRAGHEEDYDRLHRAIPSVVAEKLVAAGVRDWRIWRDGRHVFHLVDVVDYEAMRRALRDDPDNLAWQAAVAPFFERPDSYDGGDTGLPQLWRLVDQVAYSDPTPAADGRPVRSVNQTHS